MTEPAGKSTAAVGLALLVAFLTLVGLFAHWLRISSSPEIDAKGPGMPALLEPPYMPALAEQVPRAKAAQIAIAEVKRREGWSGKADAPEREGHWWYVTVWREPKSPESSRQVVVHSQDGHICDYVSPQP